MPNYVTNRIRLEANAQQMDAILKAVRRDGDVYGSFDFNKLIPMPESLDLESGGITDDAIIAFISHMKSELDRNPDRPGQLDEIKRYVKAAILALAKPYGRLQPIEFMPEKDIETKAEIHQMSVPAFLELGKTYLDNQIQYGDCTWYTWRNKNWGTKWNTEEGNVLTCDVSGDKELSFDTAWSAPFPVMIALSEKFPDIKISHFWADENIGYNVGSQVYLNGQTMEEHIPEPGSKEAYEMSFEVLGHEAKDFYLRYDPDKGTYVYDETLEEGFEPKMPTLNHLIDQAKEKAALPAGEDRNSQGKEEPER